MINFVCGGLLGDFIQCLFAVKQICEVKNEKANLYITNQPEHGGDKFKYTIDIVYEELLPILIKQNYIQNFEIYQNQTKDFINLNNFRKSPLLYKNNWTEFLQSSFDFSYKPPYKWISIESSDSKFKDKILIHRSMKVQRQTPNFPFQKLIDKYGDKLVFISNEPKEYDSFPFKSQIPFHRVNNLSELFIAINSCEFFIGNQSSPYTIASSIDKTRVLELGDCPDKFSSIGENKYSTQILDISDVI